MGRILSIDLAYRRVRDIGVCPLEERSGKVVAINFDNPEEVGLPPRTEEGVAVEAGIVNRELKAHARM